MYFYFALNRYMTLSSADNPFKQFGPRSGPPFCPGMIVDHTIWRFRGYDKLKLTDVFLTLRLTFTWHCHLLVTIFNFMGAQSDGLIETVLLSTLNMFWSGWIWEFPQFYAKLMDVK